MQHLNANTHTHTREHHFVHLGSLITISLISGSNDPEPAPLRLLLQLPTEEPAGVQAGGAPLPQNGVRDSPHVQRGHLQ